MLLDGFWLVALFCVAGFVGLLIYLSPLRRVPEDLRTVATQLREELRQHRQEQGTSLHHVREELSNQSSQGREELRQQLSQMGNILEQRLGLLTQTLEKKLTDLQDRNAQKLEEMRLTVDEKLQRTLNQRLAESFKQVQDKLEAVHVGLGKMEVLATGVGDLKRVLSNVKTRGILGEYQLGNLLEQVLTPSQYDKDIATKKGSSDRVEFAVRLPGRDNGGAPVYLPIDSKFPLEPYERLLDAFESAQPEAVKVASRELELTLKKFSKDIRDKYIDVPHTTDFAILFLPMEGLYAEVLRQPGLVEVLARDYRVNVTGPSTLAALLNSLNMGFQTLAFEKRSQEIRDVLAAVKTEFGKFGDVLGKVQKNLSGASNDLDALIGTRTLQIQRKLRGLEELPETQAQELLKSS